MLYRQLFDPANVSADHFVDDGALVEDTAIALDATDTPDGLAHQIAIDPSGDIDGIIFTVVGLDADGNEQTEAITGSTTNTVESTKYYKSLTSVTPDTTDVATVDIGFVDEFVSPTIKIDWRRNAPFYILQEENGTIELDVQLLMVDPDDYTGQEAMPWALHDAQLDDFLDNERFAIGPGYTAARIKVNSYTDTADVTITIVQPEPQIG